MIVGSRKHTSRTFELLMNAWTLSEWQQDHQHLTGSSQRVLHSVALCDKGYCNSLRDAEQLETCISTKMVSCKVLCMSMSTVQ